MFPALQYVTDYLGGLLGLIEHIPRINEAIIFPCDRIKDAPHRHHSIRSGNSENEIDCDRPSGYNHPPDEDDNESVPQRPKSTTRIAKKINRDLAQLMQQKEHQQLQCFAAIEWRTLAMVVDRLFFIIYLITMGVALGLVVWRTDAVDMVKLVTMQNAALSPPPSR